MGKHLPIKNTGKFISIKKNVFETLRDEIAAGSGDREEIDNYFDELFEDDQFGYRKIFYEVLRKISQENRVVITCQILGCYVYDACSQYHKDYHLKEVSEEEFAEKLNERFADSQIKLLRKIIRDRFFYFIRKLIQRGEPYFECLGDENRWIIGITNILQID